MRILQTKRLDHLGLVMGTLKEFNIINFIDERLSNPQKHNITTGEAVAAMLVNGLGFVSVNRSL